METSEILMQVKTSTETPKDWIVFPLVRSNVLLSIAGWVLGIVVGLGLFTIMAFSVIPHNYQYGILPAVFTTLFLGLFLFVGLGSIWALIADAIRLVWADKHLIVITPDAFVKQEGEKVIHVPLLYVRHVTARGAPPPDRSTKNIDNRPTPNLGENVMSLFAGRGMTSSGMRWRRKRMRTPTSLAFVDSRTDNEVIVINDKSHGDPFMIAALLKQYAASVQNIA
jgi:hypothetical protein